MKRVKHYLQQFETIQEYIRTAKNKVYQSDNHNLLIMAKTTSDEEKAFATKTQRIL